MISFIYSLGYGISFSLFFPLSRLHFLAFVTFHVADHPTNSQDIVLLQRPNSNSTTSTIPLTHPSIPSPLLYLAPPTMRLTSLLIPLISLVSAASAASKVIDLDSTNFDTYVGNGKPALVEFFAPWVSRVYVGIGRPGRKS